MARLVGERLALEDDALEDDEVSAGWQRGQREGRERESN